MGLTFRNSPSGSISSNITKVTYNGTDLNYILSRKTMGYTAYPWEYVFAKNNDVSVTSPGVVIYPEYQQIVVHTDSSTWPAGKCLHCALVIGSNQCTAGLQGYWLDFVVNKDGSVRNNGFFNGVGDFVATYSGIFLRSDGNGNLSIEIALSFPVIHTLPYAKFFLRNIL